MTAPKPPTGLKRRGKLLWTEIAGALDEQGLELEEHERSLLLEACRTVDQLDALDAILRRGDLTLPDGRVNPALVEARQQRITLTRLIASLRLPEDPAQVGARPQRRGAARGSYLRSVN